jgi:hypothetical protein
MLIFEEHCLAMPKEDRIGLVCINTGNNKIGD